MVALRDPEYVMNLARMGSGFPNRLSFMRSLLRRLHRENWRFERTRFDLDEQGYGISIYAAIGPDRTYSLIGFSHYLDPDMRTDRVIATQWDATFSLFDGVPTEEDIERLRHHVPKQEAGRFRPSDLCLARANKSLRLFDHVVARLSEGCQPDLDIITSVGYLMRTTAVYSNGKFGCGGRERTASRPEAVGAFQLEMLTVFLVRWFTIDLVEHVARVRGGNAAVSLDPEISRFLGIGNSTGLGMAPFMVRYPILINNWVMVREEALSRVRGLNNASPDTIAQFEANLIKVRQHVDEWNVDDDIQTARIERLRLDLAELQDAVSGGLLSGDAPWDHLYRFAEDNLSVEMQELAVSMILEPHGETVDGLCDCMYAEVYPKLDATMTVGALRCLVKRHYGWALDIDFREPSAQQNFWYYSEEKLEPRFSDRYEVPGAEMEMPLAVGRDVNRMMAVLDDAAVDDHTLVAEFVMKHPEYRHVIRRVQTVARYPYGEIYDNLVAADVRPIDMLRFKLAFFGAAKFDPRSDRWTRITMYQGAPMPHELGDVSCENWTFPVMPSIGD